jgi:hypothetical protein
LLTVHDTFDVTIIFFVSPPTSKLREDGATDKAGDAAACLTVIIRLIEPPDSLTVILAERSNVVGFEVAVTEKLPLKDPAVE